MKMINWICLGLMVVSVSAKQNVILFVTDDQSPDAGCYGNAVIQTPAIDALAKDGTIFPNAFCTTASCSASRSVILSGLYNHANGQYGHHHSFHHFRSWEDLKTLPVIMTANGYRTARCGKFHVGPEAVYQFEQSIPGNSRHAWQMAENCRELIEADSDEPFFLYICTSDPHRGGGFAAELPYKPDRFGNLPNQASRSHHQDVIYDPARVMVPPFLPDTPTCRAEIAQYYQSITRIDQGLAHLMGILKAAGKYDETLVIYTADHGMAFPGGKTTLYEGGMQIPFIVKKPNPSRKGMVSQAKVSLVDLTPTILDFAGAIGPETVTGIAYDEKFKRNRKVRARSDKAFHGRSFLSVIEEEDPGGAWDTVYASHTFHEIQMYYPMRVVHGPKYKLIWNIAWQLPYPFASDLWAAPTWQAQFKQGPNAPYGLKTVGEYIHRKKFELFDLEKDPDETTNLAENPEYAEVLEKMQKQLRAFQLRTDDGWELKWRYE